ncbi:hypothetical protein CVT24_009657 [Panaeolus cyanescens]|uniref:Uncharacterized protein n=1 Tax=Panaeolus cyanescens TaxID=181874 RepID=A0A409Y9X1_9AGAR|nr:hypothetical protein CVT24_009657 [Panaeolus cyanescens]
MSANSPNFLNSLGPNPRLENSRGYRLPVEIYQRIFDNIEACSDEKLSEYYRDIAHCRASSRLFHNLRTPLMFRYGVELAATNLSDKNSRLTVDQARPILHAYLDCNNIIRHLSYRPTRTGTNRTNVHDGTNDDGPEFDRTSSSPFLQLPNVQSITIDMELIQFLALLESIPTPYAACRPILDHYLSSGTLTTLSISNLHDVPILAIFQCPSILDLKIYRCTTQRSHAASAVTIRSNLRSFFARDYHMPLEFLRHLTKVQRISLKSSFIQPTLAGYGLPRTPLEPTTFPLLEEICTDISLSVWLQLCGTVEGVPLSDVPKAFPALKKLECPLRDKKSVDATRTVLSNHITVLEDVKFTNICGNVEGSNLIIFPNILFSIRHTLKTLSFEWEYDFVPPGGTDDILHELCDALRRIEGDNVLQDLNLSARTLTDVRGLASTLQSAEWTTLGPLLASPDSFPFLRCVNIDITMTITYQSFEGQQKFDEEIDRWFSVPLAPLRESPTIAYSMKATPSFDYICSEFDGEWLNDDQARPILRAYPECSESIRHLLYKPNCPYQRIMPSGIEGERTELDRLSPFLQLRNVQSISIDMLDIHSLAYRDPIPAIYTVYLPILDHYLWSGTLTTLYISEIQDVPILTILQSPSILDIKICRCTTPDSEAMSPSSAAGKFRSNLCSFFADDYDMPLEILRHLTNIRRIVLKSSLLQPTRYRSPTNAMEPTTFLLLNEIYTDVPLDSWLIFCGITRESSPVRKCKAFPALKKLQCPMSTTEAVEATRDVLLYHVSAMEDIKFMKIRDFLRDPNVSFSMMPCFISDAP